MEDIKTVEDAKTEVVATPAVTSVSAVLLPVAPKTDSLSREDLITWGKNTFIFSVPAILAILLAVQSGVDVKVAIGMGVQALIASAIDLLSKYKKGV